MLAVVFIVILVFIVALGVYQKKTNAVCVSKKRLDRKTVLVTGGTAGMGLEIALEMARRGARVIIACPFPEEGASALDHIVRSTGNHDVVFQHLDLASLASVRRFATNILQNEPRLNILFNNAGIGGSRVLKTVDGINIGMQVNYFGTVLLTLLLLPILKKSGRLGDPSQIVNTASIMHRLGVVDVHNLTSKKLRFISWEYYADSKFCIVLFTRELAKRLRGENVVVNSVDPGAVGTRIFDDWLGQLGLVLTWFCYCLFKTPWQGAQTALHVVLDESVTDESGEYFINCHKSRASSRAYDDALANEVWEQSLKIVKFEI